MGLLKAFKLLSLKFNKFSFHEIIPTPILGKFNCETAEKEIKYPCIKKDKPASVNYHTSQLTLKNNGLENAVENKGAY